MQRAGRNIGYYYYNRYKLLGETLVGFKTEFGKLLGLGKQLFGSVREHLVERSKTHLALQEVLELTPIRFFGIKRERIFIRTLKSRIVTIS